VAAREVVAAFVAEWWARLRYRLRAVRVDVVAPVVAQMVAPVAAQMAAQSMGSVALWAPCWMLSEAVAA
jgi:hypothetical protein